MRQGVHELSQQIHPRSVQSEVPQLGKHLPLLSRSSARGSLAGLSKTSHRMTIALSYTRSKFVCFDTWKTGQGRMSTNDSTDLTGGGCVAWRNRIKHVGLTIRRPDGKRLPGPLESFESINSTTAHVNFIYHQGYLSDLNYRATIAHWLDSSLLPSFSLTAQSRRG